MRYYDIPEGDGLRRLIRNAREEAIYDVLGGIKAAAEALGVRRQSVHYLLAQPRIRDVDTAKGLSEATARAGRLVPAAEILDHAPWRGPDRNGTGPRGRRPKDEVPSASPHGAAAAEPATAPAEVGTAARLHTSKRPSRRNAPAQNRTGT